MISWKSSRNQNQNWILIMSWQNDLCTNLHSPNLHSLFAFPWKYPRFLLIWSVTGTLCELYRNIPTQWCGDVQQLVIRTPLHESFRLCDGNKQPSLKEHHSTLPLPEGRSYIRQVTSDNRYCWVIWLWWHLWCHLTFVPELSVISSARVEG